MAADGLEGLTLDEIIVTSASQQGLDMTGRVFLAPGDAVVCGLPSYLGALGAFAASGARMTGIVEDDEGMPPDRLEERLVTLRRQGIRPKVLYLVPDFQNPSGVTLTRERRIDILSIASEFDLLVLEDSPYRQLRYVGEHLPSMKSLDGEGRVRPARREAENLIVVGAFDWTGVPRTGLLWELYGTYEGHRKEWRKEPGMFDACLGDPERPGLREFSVEERLRHEIEVLGLAISAHPVALLRRNGRASGWQDSRELARRASGPVKLLGIPAASRRVPTSKGEDMFFLTIEDEFDVVECTLFPAVFRRYMGDVRGTGPFAVEGSIEDQYGARTVNVRRIASLAGDEPLLGRMLEEEAAAETGTRTV
jgi:hypothetical protein